MKFNIFRIVCFMAALFALPSHALSSNLLRELESASNKWRNLSHCQREFVLGYAAYGDRKFKNAVKHFSECDGEYSILQDYITEFIGKSAQGGEAFTYIDHISEIAAEVKKLGSEPQCPERDFALAKAYFKARRYKEAGELFEKFISDNTKGLYALESLATSLTRQDRYAEAIEVQKKIISDFSKSKSTITKARFKLGFLYLDSGEYGLSEEEFLRLQKFDPSYKSDYVRWYLAWCAYKTRNFEKAIARFKALQKRGGKVWPVRALYWGGIAFEKNGVGHRAREIFEKIIKERPLSYYAILAQEKIGGLGGLGGPGNMEEADEAVPGSPSNLVTQSPNSPDLSRAQELDQLGVSDLVARELTELLGSKKRCNNRDKILELARRNDVWNVVNLIARSELGKNQGVNTNVWKDAYPRAYDRVVTAFSKRFKLEPLLVFSVMREESTFRPSAVSRSGAIGLLQIMPRTARRTSERLYGHKRGRFETSDLLRPVRNIDLGTGYLDFLLKRYKGNVVYAVAAYNAGEEAVDRWVKNYTKSLDPSQAQQEFVEEIPYAETQDYVRKVMRSYWIYKALYL